MNNEDIKDLKAAAFDLKRTMENMEASHRRLSKLYDEIVNLLDKNEKNNRKKQKA